MSRPPAPPLVLTFTATTGKSFIPYLRRHLRAAHATLRSSLRELSIALVGDHAMSQIHKQFMDESGVTDVITFPLEVDGSQRPTSGELILCVPEARRRARIEGTELRHELLLYALHGMLHLCGFDDRTEAGFAAMHRTEDRILTRLGIGPVFANAKPPAKRPVQRAARRSAKRPGRTPRRAIGAD